MKILLSLFLIVFMVPNAFADDIIFPTGIYSSHVGKNVEKYIHAQYVNGALIRVRWSEIEKQEGQYDFSAIERQRAPIINAGKNWSLAVLAGWNTPKWLDAKTKDRMNIQFRGEQKNIIPFWSKTYLEHADKLAQALAAKYGNDPHLVLIYVPQQTANGIEGHFNGTPFEDLKEQGLSRENWLHASHTAINSYTKAFPNKAIAFELHEIFKSTDIPDAIIKEIKQNHKNQVGIGVWWLSGKWDYQKKLLQSIAKSNLPVYAQVIGKSSQKHRFPDGDYTRVFKQAKDIGADYIEVWNYELENSVESDVMNAIKSFSSDMKNK